MLKNYQKLLMSLTVGWFVGTAVPAFAANAKAAVNPRVIVVKNKMVQGYGFSGLSLQGTGLSENNQIKGDPFAETARLAGNGAGEINDFTNSSSEPSKAETVILEGYLAAEPGKIVIISQGSGKALRVLSSSFDGTMTTITGTPAELVEIFDELDLKTQLDLTNNIESVTPLIDGVEVNNAPSSMGAVAGMPSKAADSSSATARSLSLGTIGFTFRDFKFPVTDSLVNNIVHIEGTTSISPSADFEIQIRPGFPKPRLTSAKFVFQANVKENLQVWSNNIEISMMKRKLRYAQVMCKPFVVPAGGIPIIVVPVISLYLEVDITGEGTLSLRSVSDISYQAGIEYSQDSGIRRIWSQTGSPNFEWSPTYVQTFGITPALTSAEFYIYGLVGPYAELALPRIRITQDSSSCHLISPNVTGRVGIKSIPIASKELDKSVEFLDWVSDRYWRFCASGGGNPEPPGGDSGSGGGTGTGTGGSGGGAGSGGTVDRVQPSGFIDNPWADNLFLRGVSTINGWTQDPSGIRSLQIMVDDRVLSGLKYPVARSDGNKGFEVGWDTRGADGWHLIRMRSTDNANNTREITRRILVDNVAPATSASLQATPGRNGYFVSLVTVNFNTQDNAGGSGTARTLSRVDGGQWVEGGSIQVGKEGNEVLVEYFSTDRAGNEEAIKQIRFKADKSAPKTKNDLTGTKGKFDWFRSDVISSLTSEDNVSGVESIEYSLNEGPFVPYDPSKKVTIIEESAGHRFRYRATDRAGNVEETQLVLIKIDKTPPVALGKAKAPRDTNGVFRNFPNIIIKSTDALSQPDVVRYSADGGLTWNEQPGDIATFVLNYNGAGSILFYSVDNAGNVEKIKDSGPIFIHRYSVFASGEGESLRILRSTNVNIAGAAHGNGSAGIQSNTGVSIDQLTTVAAVNAIRNNTASTLPSIKTGVTKVDPLRYTLDFYRKYADLVLPRTLLIRSTTLPLKGIIYAPEIINEGTTISGKVALIAERDFTSRGTISALNAGDPYNGIVIMAGRDVVLFDTGFKNGLGLIYAGNIVRISSTNFELNGSIQGKEVEIVNAGTVKIAYNAGFAEGTYDLPLTAMVAPSTEPLPPLPSVPTNLSPSNTAVTRTSTALSWKPVSNAGAYWVQMATEPTFAAPIADICLLDTSYVVSVAAPLKYFWRVCAINRAGIGAWTNGSFTTSASVVKPKVSGFTPASGRVGAVVIVKGSGFTGVSKVEFGSKDANFQVNSDTQITTTVPAGASTDSIKVKNSEGSATSSSDFRVTR